MYQEAAPIPYTQQPSLLVLTLEAIMRRDEYHKQFHHTFEALEKGVHPRSAIMYCPCGIAKKVPMPHEKHCEVVACVGCGTWHTILWRGEKSLEERMEDREIRLEMAGVNPFTKSPPTWLQRIFEKTKMRA